MPSFFLLTLLISIAALTLLLTLKQIEVSTGSVIFASMRPRVNRFFKTCLLIVERVLPALAREGLMSLVRRIKKGVQWVLAHWLLRFETALQRTLKLIREKTHPSHARGEASAFLKEVGEYKKQIETETKEEQIKEQNQ